MTRVHIDFETRSMSDLPKTGAWKYSQDPSTVILCMYYSIDNMPPVRWLPTDEPPHELFDLINSDAVFVAHNAFFERSIWANVCVARHGWPEIPHTKWRCTLAKAAAHALPVGLGKCGNALHLKNVKDDEGKRVMMKLSKYRTPSKNNQWPVWEDPLEYEQLYDYCEDDVEAERDIDDALRDLSDKEQQVWLLDQQINSYGVHLDREAIEAAIDHIEHMKELYDRDMLEVTKGAVERGTQRERLLKWIRSVGYNIEKLDADSIQNALNDLEIPENVKRALQIRQETSKTSTGKYYAMRDALCDDDRIRDYLNYHAATTGRWSSKIVQFQNIPRGNIKDMEAAVQALKKTDSVAFYNQHDLPVTHLSHCIRGMISAPPGKDLVVADYSAIEGRGVMWLADEQRTLDIFRKKDSGEIDYGVYEMMASDIFSTSVKHVLEDHANGGIMRFVGKQAVLGCGYQMGAAKFKSTCESFGQNIDKELAERAVSTFREKHPKLRTEWYAQNETAMEAVVKYGKPLACGKITWLCDKKFLYCMLPSGRVLSYYEPEVNLVEKWGNMMPELSYMGVDSFTKQWKRISTYGGKLVENITQGIARDVMADAMLKINKDGRFNIVLTVHDEIIVEVAEGTGRIDEFCGIMGKNPDWALDMPIVAEGWIGKRYKK